MSTVNFQRRANGVGLALPLSHTTMTRRATRSQQRSRKSQGIVPVSRPEIGPQAKVRRMSDIRLIELMERRDREARAVTAHEGEKKTKKQPPKEHFFSEFF